MPKSIPSTSPTILPKSPHDDPAARLSDVAIRKKKNADAQAAFRARRANYIATLEETVTSLESVVLQLQESCRESRAEAQELRQENGRLRHEFREREKYWRVLWQSRKSGQSPDEVPPLPPPSNLSLLPAPSVTMHVGSSHLQQYSDEHLSYRNDETCSTTFSNSEHSYTTSPSMPLTEPDLNPNPADDASCRLPKYSPYSYPNPMHGSPRDSRWQLQPMGPTVHPGGDPGSQPSHSPVYVESPTLTASDIPFTDRFSGEDQKATLHAVLDNAPYAFSSNDDRFSQRMNDSIPGSRSISPTTTATTPTASSSSTALTSPFQFTFPDPAAPADRREFDFRRHSLPHGEITLHGGTADISLSGLASDAVRYRLGSGRKDGGGGGGGGSGSGRERATPLPGLPGLGNGITPGVGSSSETGSHHDRANSDDGMALTSRLRRRRGALPSSRSPSPGPPSMSCTVAVIKAQAFGALRRTRARGKKSSEGAAKVAMDVLEARGIGIGGSAGSNKRQRINDGESLAMET